MNEKPAPQFYPAIQPMTKHGLPLPPHPLAGHLNKMPVIPGYERATWNGFEKATVEKLLIAWGQKADALPAKGQALYISFPASADFPLIRVSWTDARSTYDKRLWACESFRKS